VNSCSYMKVEKVVFNCNLPRRTVAPIVVIHRIQQAAFCLHVVRATLLAATETQHQVQGRLLLDVVV
jgi:hypothetical protein